MNPKRRSRPADDLVVRGPNLLLRYAESADADALFELASDPEVTRFFSWGPYRQVSQAASYITSLAPLRRDGTRLEFVICGREGVPIGVTGLSEFSRRDRRAVVGTWLGRAHWGTGANRESKALILTLAFRRLGLLRATAFANPANARSLAALKRLGFVEEGVLRAWQVHGGVPQDCSVLRFLKNEFQHSELAAIPAVIEGEPPATFVTG